MIKQTSAWVVSADVRLVLVESRRFQAHEVPFVGFAKDTVPAPESKRNFYQRRRFQVTARDSLKSLGKA